MNRSSVVHMTDDAAVDQSAILARVEFDTNGGCWLWTGRVSGYKFRGRARQSDGRHIAAARMSFVSFSGPVPSGLQVLHKCNVPACVNPAHLYAGTHQDNMRDLAKTGWYTRQTHCVRGHLLDSDAALRRGNVRKCRLCARERLIEPTPSAPHHSAGESNTRSALTLEQVRSIRRDSRSNRVLGAIYGVHFTAISKIKRGLTWRAFQ